MKGHFLWRGEPIADIHQWAALRGERMVRYHAERMTYLTGVPVKEEYDGEMPETFWNSLLAQNGWMFREITP